VGRGRWLLLTLLVVAVFVNYADRSNLAIAAPLLLKELSLSSLQMGALLSAFSITYALLQLTGFAGWLADRFPVGIVFAAGFLIWSGATAITGLVSGITMLFAMRLLLGAGESLAYPCISKILASDFPQEQRGLANSLLDAGMKLGPALGTLLGGLLMSRFGWRVFFLATGLGGLLWLIPWYFGMPRTPGVKRGEPTPGPTVWHILEQPSAWGSFGALFCANYFWFFLLTWLPTYLVRDRGYSMDRMATVGSMAYFAIAAATVVAGWLSDRWIARGMSPTRARKGTVITGLTLSTAILPVAVVNDAGVSLGLLMAACLAFGIFCSNHWAITQTLAGPLAAGRWTSIQNGVGNIGGIVAPWFTGWVVERTDSFVPAFVAAAVIVLAGAALYAFAIGKVEQVNWSPHA